MCPMNTHLSGAKKPSFSAFVEVPALLITGFNLLQSVPVQN